MPTGPDGLRGVPQAGALAATISAEDGLFRVTSLIRGIEYRSEALQLLPVG